MVGLVEVELLEILLENNNRVANEEMGEVGGEAIIHTAVHELVFDVFIDDQIGVKVFLTKSRVKGNVCRV